MFNQAILIGNVGQDPEVKAMRDGSSLVSFSLATKKTWKDRNGEKQEKTQWHNITIFGKLGDVAARFVKKGSIVQITGSIEYNDWKDKEGQKRTTTQILATGLVLLSSSQSKGNTTQRTNSGGGKWPKPQETNFHEDLDDDIPY